MIFYRAFQPLLMSLFSVAAFVMKHLPALKEKSEKIWLTHDIRYVDGRPAFLKIDKSVFNGKPPIWIHAASGEFEYAKPVIRELAKQGRPVLVTYFSPTYAENVRKFPGVTASCPLPLDSRDEIEAFLDHAKPSALMIARTDTWPNTVLATSERRIPILLFSATFHDGSKRLKGLIGRSLTVQTLKRINEIQCVSEEDRQTLQNIGMTQIKVTGDSRYDQVLERLRTPKALPENLRGSLLSRVLVAGSVWSEDLQPLIKASTETFRETPHTLVIVPHEISEASVSEIETACEKHGVRTEEIIRFSQLGQSSNKYRVILIDAVGMLAEIYALGEIAFVGGSFKKTVHSVMEPLAAGCLTIVGPKHSNNREAIEFQKLKLQNAGPSFVSAVQDAASFTWTLRTLWQTQPAADYKSAIRSEVKKRGGATAQILFWLNLVNDRSLHD